MDADDIADSFEIDIDHRPSTHIARVRNQSVNPPMFGDNSRNRIVPLAGIGNIKRDIGTRRHIGRNRYATAFPDETCGRKANARSRPGHEDHLAIETRSHARTPAAEIAPTVPPKRQSNCDQLPRKF
jgi:hypothetical protein